MDVFCGFIITNDKFMINCDGVQVIILNDVAFGDKIGNKI